LIYSLFHDIYKNVIKNIVCYKKINTDFKVIIIIKNEQIRTRYTIPGGPIKFGGPIRLGGPIGPQLGSNGGGPRNLGPAGPGGQFGLGGPSKGNPLFVPRNIGPLGPNPLPLNLGGPPLIGKSNPPLPRPLKLFLHIVTGYLIVLTCHL